MNGPQHYAEAERVLKVAESPAGAALKADGFDLVAIAQVHATLAQVAAIANHQSGESSTPLAEVPSAWDNARNGAGLTWSEVLK